MSKSLYNEAIADAQKLRELAEETAKNRVIEAVMPQIRSMVNRRIFGEQLEELPPEEEFVGQDMETGVEDTSDLVDVDVDTEDVTPAAIVNVSAQGDVNIEVEGGEESSEDEEVLTDTMAEALSKLLKLSLIHISEPTRPY